METFLHTQNCAPTSRHLHTTPFTEWFKKKPDISYMHIFGCLEYVHVQQKKPPRTQITMRKAHFHWLCARQTLAMSHLMSVSSPETTSTSTTHSETQLHRWPLRIHRKLSLRTSKQGETLTSLQYCCQVKGEMLHQIHQRRQML